LVKYVIISAVTPSLGRIPWENIPSRTFPTFAYDLSIAYLQEIKEDKQGKCMSQI
jgi:hypothetical protein